MAQKTRPIFESAPAGFAITGVFAVLAANWVVAVGRYQANVLYWDQWGFFTAIMEGKGAWEIFAWQHGPHRQGLAFLLTSWIMSAAHWDERIDSLWIICSLALAGAFALLLRRRIAGPLRAGDAWIVAAVLAIGQCDSVITTPNASHSVFPLLLTLALANFWLTENLVVRYVLSAVCTVFLEFTGFGLFAAGVSTVALGAASAFELRRGNRTAAALALAGLVVCIAGWTAFCHGYVFDPAAPGFRFPWSPVTDYLKFAILMLTVQAGWENETGLHYGAGILTLAAVTAAIIWAARGLIRRPALNSREAVTLLLGSSSLFYCFETAVGRVQMGVSSGLTSRYVTLIIPALIAVYFWANSTSPRWRWPVCALLWALVATPYAALRARPISDWPGSLGESSWMYARTRDIAEQKLAFVTGYLGGADVRSIAAERHALVFPADQLDYIEPRLKFQQAHGLSFFADAGVPLGYAPWFVQGCLHWISGYAPEGRVRWLGDTATIEVASRKGGYLNLRIDHAVAALPASSALEVQAGKERGTVSLEQGMTGVSVRVGAGVQSLTLRSSGGALLPGNGDTRRLSYLLDEPTFSVAPRFRMFSPSVQIPN